MSVLAIGRDKTPLSHHISDPALIIDDGIFIDTLDLSGHAHVTVFDPAEHSFNPISDMYDTKADAFLEVLDAAFPQGQTTLTSRYSNHLIFKALLANKPRLEALIQPPKDNKDIYQKDAYEKIERLLLYRVLERVLNRGTRLSFTGTIVMRLDPSLLGDRVCFVLANMAINQYPGQVVITDFGRYAIPAHRQLITQGRLLAGVNFFDELTDEMKNALLAGTTKETRIPSLCNPDDAAELAVHAGHPRGSEGHTTYIDLAIKRAPPA